MSTDDTAPTPAVRDGGSPGSTDIERRSSIARFLGKEVWPADRERLLEVAAENQATDAVLHDLGSLPAGETFDNVQQVAERLGLASSEREGPGAD